MTDPDAGVREPSHLPSCLVGYAVESAFVLAAVLVLVSFGLSILAREV